MLVHMAEAAGGPMADLEGPTAAVFMAAVFTPAGSMAAGSMAGSMTVDLEGFAVASACLDGPITPTQMDGIIIPTTVTARANTATHTRGITAPTPPAITLM